MARRDRMDGTNGNPSAGGITRRALITGGGALVTSFLLPRVPGADDAFYTAFGPQAAYGDEVSTDGTYPVDIVDANRAAVRVLDVTDASKQVTVGNAQVKISSVDVDYEHTFTTDAQSGSFSFDIRPFCKTPTAEQLANPKFFYCANVSVEVWCHGYRVVDMPQVQIVATRGYIYPVQKKTGEDAYLSRFSFVDHDIQYNRATFLASGRNSVAQPLRADIWLHDCKGATVEFLRIDLPAGRASYPCDEASLKHATRIAKLEVSVNYKKLQALDKADEAAQKAGKDVDWKAHDTRWLTTAEAGDRFLYSLGKKVFTDRTMVFVQVTPHPIDGSRANELTVQGRLVVHEALFGDVDEDEISMVPGLSGTGGLSFTMPDSWPVIGGDEISIWTPRLPFLYDFSPFGYVMLGIQAMPYDMFSESNNPFKKDAWTNCAEDSVSEQYDFVSGVVRLRAAKALFAMSDAWSPGPSEETKYFQHDFFSTFSATVAIQAFAEASYDWDDKQFRGAVSGLVAAEGSATFTTQLFVFGVPLFASLAPSVGMSVGATLGVVTALPKDTDLSTGEKLKRMFTDAELDFGGSAFGLSFNIGIALIIGAGVAEVASIACRGAASMNMYLSLLEPDMPANHSLPRTTMSAGFDASILVQIWLFKYSKHLWSIDAKNFYDSWRDGASTQSLDGGSFENGDGCLFAPEFAFDEARTARAEDDPEPVDGVVDLSGLTLADLIDLGTIIDNDELGETCELAAKAESSASTAALDAEEDELVHAVAQDNGVYRLTLGDTSDAAVATLSADDDDSDYADEGEFYIEDACQPVDSGFTYEKTNDMQGKISGVDSSTIAGVAGVGGVTATLGDGYAGVAGLASTGGITPSVDTKIIEGVFSDPRLRIVQIGYKTFMFRLASVEYPGEDGRPYSRSRLVYQQYEGNAWSEPRPIDFVSRRQINIERSEMFDYDFDIVSLPRAAKDSVAILLVSGTRPEGDDSTFAEVCTNAIMTCLVFGNWANQNQSFKYYTVLGYRSWITHDHGADTDGAYVMNYAPCLTAAQSAVSTWWARTPARRARRVPRPCWERTSSRAS